MLNIRYSNIGYFNTEDPCNTFETLAFNQQIDENVNNHRCRAFSGNFFSTNFSHPIYDFLVKSYVFPREHFIVMDGAKEYKYKFYKFD